MVSKNVAIGGTAAAATTAVAVGVGVSQSSYKAPTNENKLVNFQFNKETEGCKEWLEQEFKVVDDDYKQQVVKCLKSKVLGDIAGYFGLSKMDLGDSDYQRGEKWNSKKSEILKILKNTNNATESDGLAQINHQLKAHCTAENSKVIDASFTDDDWTKYLTVCINEGNKLKEALKEKFWVNENKEPAN